MDREPKLYGIENSNRRTVDFFGKNQFNSSFPVSLACYMRDNGLKPVYIHVNKNLEVITSEISFDEVFNSEVSSDQLTFNFESKYDPYQKYAYNDIKGIDLVIRHKELWLRPLEIKLTVIPDSTTYKSKEDKWGTELVIRPASTKYCALGIADSFSGNMNDVREIFEPTCHSIQDWGNKTEIGNRLNDLVFGLNEFQRNFYSRQKPFLLQPIWKTDGRNPNLKDHAFDIFVWSDHALFRTFIDRSRESEINRFSRSSVRLARILYELSTRGIANIDSIYTEMAFGFQTDKEFAISGKITRDYMHHPRLIQPLLKKDVLSKIILNGGENKLSPERRFDQTIFFTAKNLFKSE